MNTQDLDKSLSNLQDMYDYHSNNPSELADYNLQLLSKLALLELGGWLEESNDLLINQSVNLFQDQLPSVQSNQFLYEEFEKVKKNINTKIENTHGFDYKTHLKPMLIHLLGSIILLKIENKIGLNDINTINGKLINLHKARSIMAHKLADKALTSIQSHNNTEVQRYITSPSILKNEVRDLNILFFDKLETELTQYISQFDFS